MASLTAAKTSAYLRGSAIVQAPRAGARRAAVRSVPYREGVDPEGECRCSCAGARRIAHACERPGTAWLSFAV